jgi:plasmid stability protein
LTSGAERFIFGSKTVSIRRRIEMATLTVKNIPDDLYEKLKQRAKAHHRSVNREIIVCIQEALESRRMDPESFVARIEALHRQMQTPPLTDKMLRQARVDGRP